MPSVKPKPVAKSDQPSLTTSKEKSNLDRKKAAEKEAHAIINNIIGFPTPVDPMAIYKEVSDWKGKCTELLAALRTIRDLDSTFPRAITIARLEAELAIKNFERNK